jgi:uncharacterized protein YidB (DUF937 family)
VALPPIGLADAMARNPQVHLRSPPASVPDGIIVTVTSTRAAGRVFDLSQRTAGGFDADLHVRCRPTVRIIGREAHTLEVDMGLLDVVNGVMNGPRGQSQPQPDAKGGISPMAIAVIGVLAYKALKSTGFLDGGQPAAAGGGNQPTLAPSAPGGGVGDILGGFFGGASGVGSGSGLGGLFGGAAAGIALNGGLTNLIKDLQNAGQGHIAQSWVGTGPNQPIAPNDLAAALGGDTLDALAKQTGMARDDLLDGLSRHLPDVIDQLTPQGRLPTAKEAARIFERAPTQ